MNRGGPLGLVIAAAVIALVGALGGFSAMSPPDGGQLAFVSERYGTDSDDIFLVNADGTGLRRLTDHPDFDSLPAWSPDGSWIAFTSRRGPHERPYFLQEEGKDDIWVMDEDGGGLTRLTGEPAMDAFPTWSPDGRLIAFMRNLQLYVMNADGSCQTRLVGYYASMPDWSPDGRWIAFVRGVEEWGLWRVRPDGSGLQRLTPESELGVEHPAWSPDGRRIAFQSFGELHVLDVESGTVTPLGVTGGDPAWSPDGTRIAFQRNWQDGEIYVMDADGTDVRRVTRNEVSDRHPVWRPSATIVAPPATPPLSCGSTEAPKEDPPPSSEPPRAAGLAVARVVVRPGLLRPWASFRATVVVRDVAGAPLAGVRVTVRSVPRRTTTPTARETGPDGSATFRLRLLPRARGSVRLVVVAQGRDADLRARRVVTVRVATRR